ncbi:MAG: 23S rRNA (uracil(1939)-C(5))-methyltransferase RlmD [Fimbriimonadaceae bacterium]|nr:23S rRNA (uracil(1939)-C(5))-methyltransferase RlmD [Fimbriimonadaceae bacterium]
MSASDSVLELQIDSLAFGGEGVGRVDGLTVFVIDACPGDRLRIELTERRERFARGRVLDVVEPSPQRVAAVCELAGQCGGCDWQHVDYPAQVAAKTRAVADTLARLGKLPDVPVAPTVPSPVPFGYRNKVELACTGTAGAVELAYHQRDPQQLVSVDFCPLALPEVNGLLEQVAGWLSESGWSVWDPATSDGLLREVGLRYSVSTREATLLLTTGRRELPEKVVRWEALRERFPQLVGLRHFARTRASQNLVGKPVGDLLGRPLRVKTAGLSLRVSPEAFFQVNDLQLDALHAALRAALDPQEGDRLADLYGGVGTFGLPLAREVGEVNILELDPTAAQDARSNARFNQLENVQVLRGQVEQEFGELLRDSRVDGVILDPPRRGLSDGVVRLVAKARPKRVAYISCDPATLARDLQRFAGEGYQTLGVQPVDLFPQTYHIESVATLAPR